MGLLHVAWKTRFFWSSLFPLPWNLSLFLPHSRPSSDLRLPIASKLYALKDYSQTAPKWSPLSWCRPNCCCLSWRPRLLALSPEQPRCWFGWRTISSPCIPGTIGLLRPRWSPYFPTVIELPEVARAREAMKHMAFIGHFSILGCHPDSKVVRIHSSL